MLKYSPNASVSTTPATFNNSEQGRFCLSLQPQTNHFHFLLLSQQWHFFFSLQPFFWPYLILQFPFTSPLQEQYPPKLNPSEVMDIS